MRFPLPCICSPSRNNNSERAFTLIELILAVAILAIVSLTLYATYANGIAISRKAAALENFYREARWAVDSLTRELENMVNYRYLDFYQNEHGGFQGDASSLSLIHPAPDGVRWVRYSLKDPDYGSIHQVTVAGTKAANSDIDLIDQQDLPAQFLVREEGSISHLFDPEREGASAEVLSRHVQAAGLKFSYAFKDSTRPDSELIWRDEWQEVSHPAGVRMELTFVHAGDEYPPLQVKKDILIPTGYWGSAEDSL